VVGRLRANRRNGRRSAGADNLPSAFRVFAIGGEQGGIAFGVRRSAFGVRRSAFGVRRSAFGVRRSAFGVRRSAFGVRRSAFGARRSEVGVRRSEVGVRRSAFRRSAFGVRRRTHCQLATDTDNFPNHLRFRETATTIIAPLITSWMLVLYPIVRRPNWTIPMKMAPITEPTTEP
jgi:hypothetical protein